MAETSYIIQNGKMMYVKDASARKSIGSCGNLKTETKHCLVDAINELNDKVGGGGGVPSGIQEQLDGKAPYGLISDTITASTDEAVFTALNEVITGMADNTVKFVKLVGSSNTFIGGGVLEVFRLNANYCTATARTYTTTAGGSMVEFCNSKYGGVWQEWTRNYSTGYKPKLTDLGLTATATELNYMRGATGNVQEQLDERWGLVAGTDIAASTNLNGIATPGNYQCKSNAIAESLTNSPVATAFTMKVFYGNGTSSYIWQEIIDNATGTTYRRRKDSSSGTWQAWMIPDVNVKQTRTTSTQYRSLLLYNKQGSAGVDMGEATGRAYYHESIQACPAEGKIKATTFEGALKGNADTATELVGGITESKTSHGDTDHWENTLPPFTGIKVNRSRANRFALMPANKILVERSTDAGVTWVEDTDFADADKVNLLTNAVANDTLRIMNNLSANERLRITLIAPSNSRTKINQIYTDISTRGHGVRVDIEGALNSAPNTFSILGNNVRLGGWNGPNVINIPEITWGPSSSSDYGKIRITYKISAVSSSQTGKAIVLAIKGYGPYAFYMHSNLAFDDCLYEVNHNGDATFPANLTAKTIAGVSPTEIGYLAGSTGNVQEQLNKIRETQTSGAEAMTEATIRAICT